MYTTPYLNSIYQQRRVTPRQNVGMARPETSMSANQPDTSGFMKDFDWGNAMGVIGSGISGYSQGAGGTQDFSIDPYAGLKGSGQGLSQGGWVGAIVGGISAQVGQFSDINKKLKDLDYGVDLSQTTANGDVAYSGAGYLQSQNTSEALREGEKSLNKGGIDPATKIFGGLFGTKRKLSAARRKMNRAISRAQSQYNEMSQTFDQNEAALQGYYDRLNMNDRLYNLYK
jgi:hypothetical protein